MIQNIWIKAGEVIVGFAGGLAVGVGYVAFLTMLGIIPRLIHLSKSEKRIVIYVASAVLGSIFGTFLSFSDVTWNFSKMALIIWGSFHGIFIGMLAAALTEVLNVFPLLFKRIGMERHLFILLMAIVFGKIAGSLFQWIIFVKQ